MNRIVIQVTGGMVAAVYATDENLEYVIVDTDTLSDRTPVSDILRPDMVFIPGYAHEFIEPLTLLEDQARDQLKTLKF